MYKSPITITQQIHKDFTESVEDAVVRAVCNVGIDVNKEQLIKALAYDRNQYQKGYEDGKTDSVRSGKWVDRYGNKYTNHLYACSECGKEALFEFYHNELFQTKSRQVLSPSCPHCGADMIGKGDTE